MVGNGNMVGNTKWIGQLRRDLISTQYRCFYVCFIDIVLNCVTVWFIVLYCFTSLLGSFKFYRVFQVSCPDYKSNYLSPQSKPPEEASPSESLMIGVITPCRNSVGTYECCNMALTLNNKCRWIVNCGQPWWMCLALIKDADARFEFGYNSFHIVPREINIA